MPDDGMLYKTVSQSRLEASGSAVVHLWVLAVAQIFNGMRVSYVSSAA